MQEWLQTDEDEDVAASLRHALRSLEFVATDIQAWKWVAIALHSALQGACVCHLVTTAVPVGVVSEKNAAEWLTYFEASRTDPKARFPRTYLLSLPDLLKKVRRPGSAGDRSNESGIAISDSELSWLCRFHEDIRNEFSHFAPKGWSIEVSGVLPLGALIARIIGEILDAGWAFRHKDEDWKSHLRDRLDELTALAHSSK